MRRFLIYVMTAVVLSLSNTATLYANNNITTTDYIKWDNIHPATGQDFPVVWLSQLDPRWASERYGTNTIGAAGCGPMSNLIVWNTYFPNNIMPIKTLMSFHSDYMNSYVPGAGSSHYSIYDFWVKHNIPVKYYEANGVTEAELTAELEKGNLIICIGTNTSEYMSSKGHYFVIAGVDEEGNWITTDPGVASLNKSRSMKAWDPDVIMKCVDDRGAQYAYIIPENPN